MLDLIQQQGIPFSYQPLSYHDQRVAGLPAKYKNLPTEVAYPLNLLLYNIHGFPLISDEQFEVIAAMKYTIVNWYWELPDVPQKWLPQFERPDEIWVASKFVQNTFQRYASCRVHVVPPAIVVPVSSDVKRERFNLPPDRYIFLFTFNSASSFGRKNPGGIIEAFKMAFGQSDSDGPLLVFKTHNLELFPQLYNEFQQKVTEIGGILINENYTRQQLNNLMACADSFISLHRAEGFGLGMAEAMYLGKPVIGTNYSANTDFMNDENSYLVDYHLRMISEEDHAYQPAHPDVYESGLHWAEPDIDQAATYMQYLVENPGEGQAKGQIAARYIRANYNPEYIGQLIKTKLLERFQEVGLPNTIAGRRIMRRKNRNERTTMRDDFVKQLQEFDELVHIATDTMPVIGPIKRLLTRLKSLGQVQAAEREIFQHLLDYTNLVSDQLADYEIQLNQLENKLAKIEMRNE